MSIERLVNKKGSYLGVGDACYLHNCTYYCDCVLVFSTCAWLLFTMQYTSLN